MSSRMAPMVELPVARGTAGHRVQTLERAELEHTPSGDHRTSTSARPGFGRPNNRRNHRAGVRRQYLAGGAALAEVLYGEGLERRRHLVLGVGLSVRVGDLT